jgi:hypothetical protein
MPVADECTCDDFVTLDKYAHAAATMTYATFKNEWWGKLVDALRTSLPSSPGRDPRDMDRELQGRDVQASAVVKVLGVPYGGKADKSWFVQKPVIFYTLASFS